MRTWYRYSAVLTVMKFVGVANACNSQKLRIFGPMYKKAIIFEQRRARDSRQDLLYITPRKI